MEESEPTKKEDICEIINNFIKDPDFDHFLNDNILLFIAFYVQKYGTFRQFPDPNVFLTSIESCESENINVDIPQTRGPPSQDFEHIYDNLDKIVNGMENLSLFYIYDDKELIPINSINDKLTELEQTDSAYTIRYFILRLNTEEKTKIEITQTVYNRYEKYEGTKSKNTYKLRFAIGKNCAIAEYSNSYFLYKIGGQLEKINVENSVPEDTFLIACYSLENADLEKDE